jgi:hypothetical protein
MLEYRLKALAFSRRCPFPPMDRISLLGFPFLYLLHAGAKGEEQNWNEVPTAVKTLSRV